MLHLFRNIIKVLRKVLFGMVNCCIFVVSSSVIFIFDLKLTVYYINCWFIFGDKCYAYYSMFGISDV